MSVRQQHERLGFANENCDFGFPQQPLLDFDINNKRIEKCRLFGIEVARACNLVEK